MTQDDSNDSGPKQPVKNPEFYLSLPKRFPSREILVLIDPDDRMAYDYDAHTHKFHKSARAYRDYCFDQDCTYTPISPDQAQAFILEDNKYDLDVAGNIYERRVAQPTEDTFSLEEIFGDQLI